MVALELETPYPADYNATVQQVARENETGHLPPLKTKIERIEQYDVVFLGFPTWGMQLPPPVKSFLRQYSLKGKTVIRHSQAGGCGFESRRPLQISSFHYNFAGHQKPSTSITALAKACGAS